MGSDLDALLAVQAQDAVIHTLEDRLGAFTPRLMDLARARQGAADALSRSRAAAEGEEKRQRELSNRVSTHRQLHDRNASQLENVHRMREVTAAMTQMEQAKRILADEETELAQMGRRLAEMHETVRQQERGLADLEAEQGAERAQISEEKGTIEQELKAERAKRDELARKVNRTLLAKYDRIRSRRRSQALFALHENSCGNCDVAVPLQRRSQMVASGNIEVCEGCGVLLYAGK